MDAPATAPRARCGRSLSSWMDAHRLMAHGVTAVEPRHRAPLCPDRGTARRPRGRTLACATGSPVLEPRPPSPMAPKLPTVGIHSEEQGQWRIWRGGGEERKEGRRAHDAGDGGGEAPPVEEGRRRSQWRTAAGTRRWGEGRGGARSGWKNLGAHQAHHGPDAHPLVAARDSSASRTSRLRRLLAGRSRAGSPRLTHAPCRSAFPYVVHTARSRSARVA
jgi:hypothetical protein